MRRDALDSKVGGIASVRPTVTSMPNPMVVTMNRQRTFSTFRKCRRSTRVLSKWLGQSLGGKCRRGAHRVGVAYHVHTRDPYMRRLAETTIERARSHGMREV